MKKIRTYYKIFTLISFLSLSYGYTNVDEVTNAIKLSNRRLISPMYLTGGMGDGGGCHPRDNIALSWLSNELKLSVNFFDNIMIAREKQTEYLAKIIIKKVGENKCTVTVDGDSKEAEAFERDLLSEINQSLS